MRNYPIQEFIVIGDLILYASRINLLSRPFHPTLIRFNTLTKNHLSNICVKKVTCVYIYNS